MSIAPDIYVQRITTEFDEGVDFSKFKTFAVRDGQLNSPSPALNSDLRKKRIETEIERALKRDAGASVPRSSGDLAAAMSQRSGDGEVGFAGAARFLEKNGSTFRSIRSRILLV